MTAIEYKADGFIGRYDFPVGAPPGRAYVHKSIFSALGSSEGLSLSQSNLEEKAVLSAVDHFSRIKIPRGGFTFSRSAEDVNLDYVIGLIWGQKEEVVVDVFAHYDVASNNPDVRFWTTRNGVIDRDSNGSVLCGEGIMLVGAEEFYRRTTNNLAEYLVTPPPFTSNLSTVRSNVTNAGLVFTNPAPKCSFCENQSVRHGTCFQCPNCGNTKQEAKI